MQDVVTKHGYLLDQLARRAAAGSTVEVVYDSTLFDAAEIDLPQAEELTITLTPSTSLIWRLDDEDQTSRLTSIVLLVSAVSCQAVA